MLSLCDTGRRRRAWIGPEACPDLLVLAAMSRISPEEVEYTANLARLELRSAERNAIARDLDRILDYVAALEELDTEGVEPTAHALALATPLRPDRSTEPLDPILALANAPQREGTAFVVPKVIDAVEEG